ncbi:MAG: DUF493 domain-containing protein [Lentisphaeria bacterium]
MRELSPTEKEMIYPAECNFKIIAEGQGMRDTIAEVLRKHGISSPVYSGKTSRTGKYQTFNVKVWVDNHETMVSLDQTLQSIEGVKTVL